MDAGLNLTGIPTQMKLDFEQRSGLSLDDVRVHYNSDKPAQLYAMAYTQGTQVYVGPGQERHLPHELGHVVQQKRGLVRPTMRLGNALINDDPRLEEAADLVAAGGAGSSDSLPTSPAIQRAEDLNVGVSLRSRDDIGEHSAAAYVVDNIERSGRSPTGLQDGDQGSRTIADVFIKNIKR